MDESVSEWLRAYLQGKVNAPHARAGSAQTVLPVGDEMRFRAWAHSNDVPFDPNAANPDYDMRGFYRAMATGDKGAQSAIDPIDGKLHYPDTYKFPSHPSFSAESKFAKPTAPRWDENDLLRDQFGRVIYDPRQAK